MEEHQPRIKPSSQAYQTSPLAKQSYRPDDPDDQPLEEEPNIVQMPIKPRSLDNIAEDPLTPRPTAKRKQAGAAQGKPRSTTGKPKATKAFRQIQTANQQPFAEELRRLEDQAERINQILAQRARQKTIWTEPSQGMTEAPPQSGGHSYPQSSQGQWQGTPAQAEEGRSPNATPLNEADTDHLKTHAQRIRQRLAELETAMEAAGELTDLPNQKVMYQDRDLRQSVPPPVQPSAPPLPGSPSAPSAYPPSPTYAQQSQPWERVDPTVQHLRQDPFGAGDRVRPPHSPHPAAQSPLLALRRLRWWRYLELPRKPIDRLGDAAIWIMATAVLRIASRYLLASFPYLSPVLLLLMLTPAILAVFLAIFMPKTGWVPFYRLFLIMVGLLVGGKF